MQTVLFGPALAHWVSGDENAFCTYHILQSTVLPVISPLLPHSQVGA